MADAELPFSEACERNKAPILDVLRTTFASSTKLLEIGSGTGQHAVHFAANLTYLSWQTSDRHDWINVLRRRVLLAGLPNLKSPFVLDVAADAWPAGDFDAVFTANTLHIMSWRQVQCLFSAMGRALTMPRVDLVIYGPFRYQGRFTTDSNARFDAQLKTRDSLSGIRDFEDVDALARAQGFELIADIAMPANNQLLHWSRR